MILYFLYNSDKIRLNSSLNVMRFCPAGLYTEPKIKLGPFFEGATRISFQTKKWMEPNAVSLAEHEKCPVSQKNQPHPNDSSLCIYEEKYIPGFLYFPQKHWIQWIQATLPIRDGGLGIRRVSMLATSAYLASAASTKSLVSAILNKEEWGD